MQEFESGSSHSATIPIANPTGGGFDYTAILYLGVNQAAMDEVLFHLDAGESKDITFDVVMPTTLGEYPVYISVFSGGALIGHYQASENIVIIAVPPAAPFVFSDVSVSARPCPVGTAWRVPTFNCRMVNPSSEAVTHTITYKLAGFSHYYNKWTYTADIKTFGLTLYPGASYDFEHDGYDPARQTCNPLLALHYTYKFWLEDENGNKSIDVTVST